MRVRTLKTLNTDALKPVFRDPPVRPPRLFARHTKELAQTVVDAGPPVEGLEGSGLSEPQGFGGLGNSMMMFGRPPGQAGFVFSFGCESQSGFVLIAKA